MPRRGSMLLIGKPPCVSRRETGSRSRGGGSLPPPRTDALARAWRPVNHAQHDGAFHSTRAGRTAQEEEDAVPVGRIGRAMAVRAVAFEVYSVLYATPGAPPALAGGG